MLGKQIGHFEITRKLGEGGMGVVYEAADHHLDRQVALKILPPQKVADLPRKQRFIQEAKAASALNHPNIITIFDISAAEGFDYIAMELVRGQTLEDLLARRRLKVPEVLKYAVQVADALAAAHAAGIVHRDLKPANVMITESGLVKVLDFGLAKLTDQAEVSEDDATRTERAVTDDGMVVGSAAYMSPEQAEGRKVDARSDIFSFGLVLYEMLSGKRAFRAETRMKTMAAVINQEPAQLAELVPGLPKELDRIVARCLRKDLARRSQSMAEIKLALVELKEESESGASVSAAPAARKPARRRRWMVAAAALVGLGAGLFFLLPWWREAPAAWTEVPLTTYQGSQGQPALSPEGNQFAFAWDGGQENGLAQIYVSLTGRGAPLKLTAAPNSAAVNPAWSPDGQTIAFRRATVGQRSSEVVLIPALGGPERVLVPASAGLSAAGAPAWSPDGKWVYFAAVQQGQQACLYVVPSAGGEPRRLLEPAPGTFGDRDPSISPDGRRLVFVRLFADFNADLFVADLRGGDTAGPPRRLTNDHQSTYSPVWTTDGKDIVYVRGENTSLQAIYRVPASGGTPSRLRGIGDYATGLAIASKGRRLAYARSFQDWNIWRMPLGEGGGPAGRPSKFLSSTRWEGSGTYSPDGKRIAFSSNRSGVRQIWVADADGSNPVALTNFTSGVAGSPKWSPDGQTIVFDARPEGLADIYSIPAAGGTPRRLTDNPAEDHTPCYSVDGRWIYFASTRSGQRLLYRMPANGGAAVQITRHGGAIGPVAAPDGKTIYYTTGAGLWKVPVDGGEETRVLEEGVIAGNTLLYTVTFSGIYFIGPYDPASRSTPLNLYRFADARIVELARFDKPVTLHFSVSPDEKWLLYSQLDSSVNDLMLVENFR